MSNQDFQENLATLEWLSMIKENDKIDIEKMKIYPTTIWNRLYRTFYTPRETRKGAYYYIKTMVDQSCELMGRCESNERKLLEDTLRKAKIGIENLQKTYSNERDEWIVSRFQTLLMILGGKLSEGSEAKE
jgi:hypothetical protein